MRIRLQAPTGPADRLSYNLLYWFKAARSAHRARPDPRAGLRSCLRPAPARPAPAPRTRVFSPIGSARPSADQLGLVVHVGFRILRGQLIRAQDLDPKTLLSSLSNGAREVVLIITYKDFIIAPCRSTENYSIDSIAGNQFRDEITH